MCFETLDWQIVSNAHLCIWFENQYNSIEHNFLSSDNHLFWIKNGNLFRKRSENAYSHKIT